MVLWPHDHVDGHLVLFVNREGLHRWFPTSSSCRSGALVEEEPPVVRQLVCWPDDLEDPVQAGHAVVGGVFAHPGDQQHPAAVGVLDAQAPYFAAEDVDAQS